MHVIGTAGHVDHGKSALVKALTGIDPDRLAEEQERGLTIDLGFAWWTLPSGREVGVVDVPGHERFIRNMLAGVGGIDAALFVVAADEGWMPQSAEHLAILDFLQVRAGVVALTKADLVDDDVAEAAAADVRERVEGTALENAAIIPVSSVTGSGLDALQAELERLLSGIGEAPDRGRPRLFVDRAFTITGAGTVVTGTLTGGRLRVGAEIELLPTGHRARVRSLQTHRRPLEEATPGSRVAANLVGLDRYEVARGDALVLPDQWRVSDAFAARVRAARGLAHPIAEKGAYELYVGAAEVPCRLKFLEDPDPADGKVPGLHAGADLLVQVFCMRQLALDIGDRFIVRDVGRWETVAGGVVLDHALGRVRRGDTEVLERLRMREASARDAMLIQLVSERGVVTRDDAAWLAGMGAAEAAAAIASAASAGTALATAAHVLDAAHARSLRASADAALESFHESRPLEAGMTRESLRAALGLDARLFAELVEVWTSDGGIEVDGNVVRLPGRGSSLSPQDEAAAGHALARLRESGVTPPEIAELDVPADLVKALERRGDLVVVGSGIAFEAGVLRGVEDRVVALITDSGPVTVAQVRDAVGTTRKYAVPLLEYLDASGLTRRQGDTRVLGPRGRRAAETG